MDSIQVQANSLLLAFDKFLIQIPEKISAVESKLTSLECEVIKLSKRPSQLKPFMMRMKKQPFALDLPNDAFGECSPATTTGSSKHHSGSVSSVSPLHLSANPVSESLAEVLMGKAATGPKKKGPALAMAELSIESALSPKVATITKLEVASSGSLLQDESTISNPVIERKRVHDTKTKARGNIAGLELDLPQATQEDDVLTTPAQPTAHAADGTIPNEMISDHEIDYGTIRKAMRAGNSVIGQGAFGTVRKGVLWGTEVAVKLLRPTENSRGVWMNEAHHKQAMEDVLSDFKREVFIMSRLRHANVVLFMGACTQWPHLAIVTEYVRCYLTPPTGRGYKLCHSLADSLDMMQPNWEFKSLTRVARDIARGMNWLHAHDIVHGDLSINNLLLAEDGTVKIVDFGLSKIKNMLQGEEFHVVDKARDVYDYGVILWQLLTRQKLRNDAEVCPRESRIFLRETPSIPENCPAWMHTLISSCWSPERASRPTFAQILDSLKGRDGLLKWRQRTTIFVEKDDFSSDTPASASSVPVTPFSAHALTPA